MPWRPLLLALAVAGAQEPGNHLCWDAPNWRGLALSYERCCQPDEADLEVEDCFQALGGWYNRAFCCHEPVPDRCDWPGILDRLTGGSSVTSLWMDSLREFPVALREFCCLFPGPDNEQRLHPCWDGPMRAGGREAFPEEFVECCFPVLRRRLHEAPADDDEWLLREVERELAPLGQQRWGQAELDAFEGDLEGAEGNRPCRVKVRQGHEVELCELARSCVWDEAAAQPAQNDCSYVLAVGQALQLVGRIRPLPDVDLFVSPMNQDRLETALPVFTRHRPLEPRGRYVLLPMEWQLHPRQAKKHLTPVQRRGAELPWEEKVPELLWRGTNSNCFPSCSIAKAARGDVPMGSCLEVYDCAQPWSWGNWLNTPRGRLVLQSTFLRGVDAKWTGTSQPMDPELWRFFLEHNLTAPHIGLGDQARWRYALNLDGTGNGDRIYWQLFAGALVFLQESPFVSWLVGPAQSAATALRPWEHYVPLRYDLSDLEERLAWARERDLEARRVAEKGRRFAAEHLGYEGILLYVDRLVRRYAERHLA